MKMWGKNENLQEEDRYVVVQSSGGGCLALSRVHQHCVLQHTVVQAALHLRLHAAHPRQEQLCAKKSRRNKSEQQELTELGEIDRGGRGNTHLEFRPPVS